LRGKASQTNGGCLALRHKKGAAAVFAQMGRNPMPGDMRLRVRGTLDEVTDLLRQG